MASATPYDPDGFSAETNPFAQDDNQPDSPIAAPHHSPQHDPEPSGFEEVVEEEREEGEGLSAPQTITDEPVDHTPASEDKQTQASEAASIEPILSSNASLITQVTDVRSNKPSSTKPVKKYKLILKVTGLERQGKKDPILKFDASTTLPRFRTTHFKDIRRTHHEFEKFGAQLNNANPECFVPPVPPAVSSAGFGTEEDEVKVKKRIQLWLDRVSSNPILARDEEFVNFIESDFGYSPINKRKPPASGMTRKALKQLQPPPDEVYELATFRPIVKQIYVTGQETITKLERVSKSRRSLGLSLNDFGSRILQYSTVDHSSGNMVNMWRRFAKVVTAVGDLESIKATTEAVTLGDGISWVSQDAYVAKEAMTNRHLLMRELAKAQANTKSKHQTAVKLKGSTNINPLKVDEAIAILEDATNAEEQLTNKVRRVTENMLIEKPILEDRMEGDIKASIAEYVVRIIESERRALSAWESVRIDVRSADSKGGLSRLGRENYPARRGVPLPQSQTSKGDSWSGDRKERAQDFLEPNFAEDFARPDDEDSIGAGDEDTLVDARNAANLLAGSTF